MSLKKTSKDLLADAIKELMQHRELKDISVENILELSGVSRATFYKHFVDKRALAEQVFLNELANVSFTDYDRPIYECEAEILRYLDENRTFYRNALKSQEFRDAWMRAMIGKVPHVIVGRSGHVFINNIEVHGAPYIVERAIVRADEIAHYSAGKSSKCSKRAWGSREPHAQRQPAKEIPMNERFAQVASL